MQRMKHLFFIFTLILVFASSAWSVDFNCPGGRWELVSSSCDNSWCMTKYYSCSEALFASVAECRFDALRCSVVSGGTRTEYWYTVATYYGCSAPQCPSAPCATGPDYNLYYNGKRIYEWKCPCTASETKSCYDGPAGTEGVGICRAGTQTCSNGWFGSCQGQVLPQTEICGDGIDNNCNGQVDEGCPASGLSGDSDLNQCMDSAANLNSGNLYHSQTLFQIQNPILALDFTISYNSNDTSATPLGKGWTHNYNLSITENPNTSLSLKKADGDVTYFYLSNGTYYSSAQSGEHSTIVKNTDSTYTQTTKDNITYTFNPQGRLFQIKDRNNNTTTLTYAGNDLTGITDSTGRIININSSNGKILSITDPAGRVYAFTYSGDFLSAITDPANTTWQYTYDTGGRMLTKTDPNGNITTYAYDANGKLLSSQDPETRNKTISYDQTTHTSTVTEKDGGIWTYKYDNNLNVPLEVTDPQGNITRYAYDYNKNLISKTEPDGSATQYTYDAQGNMTSITDALSQITTYAYNNFGQVTSVTDPLSYTTANTYDANGNLLSVTDPAGAVTRYEYDTRGNMTRATNALGYVTILAYDQANNMVSITDPLGAVTTFTYDVMGNLLTITDATAKTTTFLYDVMGRLTRMTDPLGNATNYTYDANGNRVTLTDAKNHTTTYEYNYRGQLTKSTDAMGNVTVLTYGNTGCPSCGGGVDNLTSITDARGQKTIFEYDLMGRLVKETDPLGKVTQYAYNAKGNLTSKTDARGNVITYSYDAIGRLLRKTYPDSTTATFTYDAAGKMLTAANQTISYTYAYDAAGRVTSAANSWNRNVSYQYDVRGRRTRVSTTDGSIDYQYDADNRLTQLASAGQSIGFAYDAAGRKTDAYYPNTLANNYLYDNSGRLIFNPLKDTAGHGRRYDYYTYDGVGNRTTKLMYDNEIGIYQDAYYYSATDRLVLVVDPVVYTAREYYLYDPVGNRTMSLESGAFISYQHNLANQLTARDQMSFTYDANGNMLTRADTSASSNSTYTYDYENRLVRADRNASGNTTTSSYYYDPFGRRIVKSVYESSGNSRVAWYVYDREDILVENRYDSRPGYSTGLSLNIHGPNIDEPVAYTNNGQMYFYHADGLGSVRMITDGAGNVTRRYSYDAYGNITASIIDRPYTYTGREYDDETGLYYYRARYYDPKIGRFISKDPIGFNGGDVNLYGYTSNNPINWIDPLGLFWEYSQSNRQLTYVDNQSGARTPIGTGYSGQGAGLNNPNMQDVPFVGPIPQGTYDIGGATTTRGPLTLPLTPRPETNTFGRDVFRIHGDNPRRNQSASEGCIILDSPFRKQINNSQDRELRVVP